MYIHNSICVYCGSKSGENPVHARIARDLGKRIASEGLRLIFGGGSIGLMGILADAVIDSGGEVIGIIPTKLNSPEVGHSRIKDLRIVDNMHERKQLMFNLSDAFICLPGGLGTLDEAFEIITWKQLGYHNKPIVIIDSENYWKNLFSLVEDIIEEGFADSKIKKLYSIVSKVDDVFPILRESMKRSSEK